MVTARRSSTRERERERKRQRCKGDVVRGCRNNRKGDRLRCSRCTMRLWRASRRAQAAFASLRDHARERGIEFTITFADFSACAWCADYVANKGNEASGLTVDRIDNRRGYVPGNIQPLTRAANAIKKAKVDAHRMRAGYRWAGEFDDATFAEEFAEEAAV